MDAAGLGEAADELEIKVQRATRLAIEQADLILYVVDVTTDRRDDAPTEMGRPSILVGNKVDLLPADLRRVTMQRLASQATGLKPQATLLTSAVTGQGCDELKRAIESALHDRPADIRDAAIALMAEHRDALLRALAALGRAIELAAKCGRNLENADLVALELRSAAAALAELVGQDQTEEILGRIFARFCVGK
jgi:tRNA modification GTPase